VTRPAAIKDVSLRYDVRVRRIEGIISTVLRVGVLVSLVLILIGTAVTFIHHTDYITSTAALSDLRNGRLDYPTTLSGVVRGIADGEGRAIVAAGLLTLLATPILRVAISLAIFAVTGDRTFLAITFAVLALLIASLALGTAAG
jgi:uncharacterized membrane protein